jgi:hypothetical protein
MSETQEAIITQSCSKAVEIHSPRRTLLNIPPEIRLRIFDHLFHMKTFVPRTILNKEITDCRCGGNLSITNRQLYNETRHIYFRNTNICLRSPLILETWLGRIRPNIMRELQILSLQMDNTFLDASILGRMLKKLQENGNSILHTIRLEFPVWELNNVEEEYPAYLPESRQDNKAGIWDLKMRPNQHPLSSLSSLAHLTVNGDPGRGLIEEAILRLVLGMKERASHMGKCFEEEYIMDLYRGNYRWYDHIHWSSIAHRYLHYTAVHQDGSVVENLKYIHNGVEDVTLYEGSSLQYSMQVY